MRWHDLLAGLDGPGSGTRRVELTGDPDVEVDAITHDSRRVEPGRVLRVHPGRRDRRPRPRARRPSAAGRGGAARRAAARRSRCRRPGCRACAPRSGRSPPRCYGDPSRAMRVPRRHRHQRQDHHHLPARGDRRSRRASAPASIGTVGARVARRRRSPIGHTTPEASELQALLARMRDAGVGTVAMEVSSHALDQHRVDGMQFAAVCFTNLSPRAPRLPRHARRVLRGQGAVVRRARALRRPR